MPHKSKHHPHAFMSSLAPRLRVYGNSVLAPIVQPSNTQLPPASRTTKRGTTVISYAEEFEDDDDFEDGEGRRRPTGLRSTRREDPNQEKTNPADRIGREVTAPVHVQPVWRPWMGAPKIGRSDHQLHAQASLPYFPIPIRINLEVSPFIPMKPFPQPPDVRGLDLTHPAYKLSEATPNLRLRDQFIWNLYETMITPDQVALSIVHELDLPQPAQMMANISGQIRSQLEEYAGIALHPLFSSIPTNPNGASSKAAIQPKVESNAATPSAATLMTNGNTVVNGTNGNVSPPKAQNGVTSSATLIPTEDSEDYHPDDAYRCIVSLNINMMKKVYTDKFEWSLLHPPGMAEKFSRQTCADMGLGGEWVPVMAHAIYEAVLRLKREACESGSIGGSGFGGEIENLALEGREAGWRFDNESLADEWEPKVEVLSKEEIEKREYDRERQIRRMRRETARFSSNAGMTGMGQTGYFDSPQDETFGRGERSKKRRRARSLSPLGTSGTPGGRGTPEVGGRESSTLTDQERSNWRCSHCRAWGNSVWGIRDGPRGPRSLCQSCGYSYERDRQLPACLEDLHLNDTLLGIQ